MLLPEEQHIPASSLLNLHGSPGTYVTSPLLQVNKDKLICHAEIRCQCSVYRPACPASRCSLNDATLHRVLTVRHPVALADGCTGRLQAVLRRDAGERDAPLTQKCMFHFYAMPKPWSTISTAATTSTARKIRRSSLLLRRASTRELRRHDSFSPNLVTSNETKMRDR